MRRILSLIITFVMLFSLSTVSISAMGNMPEKPIRVKLCNYINPQGKWVKEKYITFDVVPQIINDRTYVPIRAIAEELGYTVEWRNTFVYLYKKLDSDFAITKNNQNLRTLNVLYKLEAGKKVENFQRVTYFDSQKSGSWEVPFKNQTSIGTIIKNKPIIAVYFYVKDNLSMGNKMQSILKVGTNYGVRHYYGIAGTHIFNSAAVIKDDRTLLPLRAFGEVLGLDVKWDANNRLVTISA